MAMKSSRIARSPNYLSWLFISLFIVWGSTWLDRMAFFYLAPYIAPALKFDAGVIGNIGAVTGLCWALTSIVGGVLSDRVGRKVVLVPAIFLMAIASAATALCHDQTSMLVVRGILGLAEGAIASVLFTVLAEEAPPARRAFIVGLVLSASPLVGSGVGPILMTQVATAFGWPAGFLAAGGPGLVFGFVLLAVMREPLRSADRAERLGESPPRAPIVTIKRNVVLTLALGTLFVTALIPFVIFSPLYLTKVDGFTPTQMGFILGAAGTGAFFSSFLVPLLADRLGRRLGLFVSVAVWALVPLSFLYCGANAVLLAVVGFLCTTTQANAAITLSVIPVESTNEKHVGAVVGGAIALGEVFGGTLSPIVAGHLADAYGLAVPMWWSFIATVLMAIFALFLRETAPGVVFSSPARVAAAR